MFIDVRACPTAPDFLDGSGGFHATINLRVGYHLILSTVLAFYGRVRHSTTVNYKWLCKRDKYAMPETESDDVTWGKVPLPPELNDAVEQYQQENDLSKPKAIEAMTRGHADYLCLLE